MLAADLAILVGDIVPIKINNGNIANTAAIETIKSEASHSPYTQN